MVLLHMLFTRLGFFRLSENKEYILWAQNSALANSCLYSMSFNVLDTSLCLAYGFFDENFWVLRCFLCRGLGAGTSCPKLVMGRSSERVVLQESPDILRFADKNIRNEEDRLYPEDAELQKLVQSWGMLAEQAFTCVLIVVESEVEFAWLTLIQMEEEFEIAGVRIEFV